MRSTKIIPCGSPPDATWSRTTREFSRADINSPLHQREMLGLSPEDGERYGLTEGERVRISSRRGAVEAPVRFDASLRPGLAFLSVHFPDQVATNILTIDATDPLSGTAEFKATAIRVEKLSARAG